MSSIEYKERVRQALQAMPHMTADEFYSQMSRSMATPLKYITMTNEQINIAIAEACGWKEVEPWLNGDRCFELAGSTYGYRLEDIPDYCNDLNAMHEAEKIFDNALYCRYIDELCTQAIKGKNCMYLATAAQRAEAFLKTINKWKE